MVRDTLSADRVALALVERGRKQTEPFGPGGSVEMSIPGGQHETVLGEHRRGSQMQRIQTAEVTCHRERVRLLDQTPTESQRTPLDRGRGCSMLAPSARLPYAT